MKRHAVIFLAFLLSMPAMAGVWYVDLNQTGAIEDGSSWATAYTTLQPAIDAAYAEVQTNTGVLRSEVWVAEGAYDEPRATADGSVRMRESIDLYGGFSGSETTRTQRDWQEHPTIISGATARGGQPAYHVITGADDTLLDGMIITGGNANGAAWPGYLGGGMYNSGTSPKVRNCWFVDNVSSHGKGGGVFNSANTAVFTNCVFSGNTADSGSGGAMYNDASADVLLINCTIAANSASADGAGLYAGMTPAVAATETTDAVDAILTTVVNCIFWGNEGTAISGAPAVTYSNVEGGFTGTGNIDADPLFVDPSADDYHLRVGSPCIDAGRDTSNESYGAVLRDIDGDPRGFDGYSLADGSRGDGSDYDMGADEFYEEHQGFPSVWYVDRSNTSATRDGRSWATAFTTIQEALDTAFLGSSGGSEVWVAAGTYDEARANTTGSLMLKQGVWLYGGFAGYEVTREQRDWVENATIIDGSKARGGQPAYHVVVGADEALLSGFTITGGNANGTRWPYYQGGGMRNDGTSPTVENCIFTENRADRGSGGAMYNNDNQAVIKNCYFLDNTANHGSGGAVYNSGTAAVHVTNCTFVGNTAAADGAGLYAVDTTTAVTNCIFWDNEGSPIGGGPDVTYSDVEGGYTGTGNIDLDPDFRSAANGDYRLNASSPCIDAGRDTGQTAFGSVMRDYEGDPRGFNGYALTTVSRGDGSDYDIGADEYYSADPGRPAVWYVDKFNNSGVETGQEWGSAFTNLQDALDAAFLGNVDGGEIWVTEGVYSGSGNNHGAIVLHAGVRVYGGFAGNEASREERDWIKHPTILDGSTARNGNPAYHVVIGADSAVLDGFVVTGGNANGSETPDNEGGGMWNLDASPIVRNCVFYGNRAERGSGAGMMNDAASPTITNCIFYDNTSVHGSGGAIANREGANPIIANCTITANAAATEGGGIYSHNSSPYVYNCIIWNNMGGSIAGETVVSYSDIEDGYTGTGNLDEDPMFEDADGADFRLQPDSPCIDAGQDTSGSSAGNVTVDFLNEDRGFDGTSDIRGDGSDYDIGAYEFARGDDTGAAVWYVDKSNTSGVRDGQSWETAFTTLQQAYDTVVYQGRSGDAAGNEVWVARGVYDELRTDNETGALVMRSGVHLYGGFAGDERRRVDRDWVANKTVIDGKKARSGGAAYHVVMGANDATLDGFVITGGYANGAEWPDSEGAGMFNDGVSPTVRNCIFRDNVANRGSGGGASNREGAPVFVNCIFWNNEARHGSGGGMYNSLGTVTVTNCTFYGNGAATEGGAMFNHSSSVFVTNCILWGNLGGTISGSTDVTYSDVEDEFDGTGNIDEDPLFVDAEEGDFRLSLDSPCIDAGRDTSAASFGNAKEDFAGNTRGFDAYEGEDPRGDGSDYDMGAFEEFQENHGPTASFRAETTVEAPLVIQFIDESTNGSEPIEEWRWTFGDGATALVQNPTHTYASAGTFIVSLSVESEIGTDLFVASVTVTGDGTVIVKPDERATRGCHGGPGGPVRLWPLVVALALLLGRHRVRRKA